MTGSDLGNAFTGFAVVFVIALALVPLGLWKLVEIIIWLCKHVSIT